MAPPANVLDTTGDLATGDFTDGQSFGFAPSSNVGRRGWLVDASNADDPARLESGKAHGNGGFARDSDEMSTATPDTAPDLETASIGEPAEVVPRDHDPAHILDQLAAFDHQPAVRVDV